MAATVLEEAGMVLGADMALEADMAGMVSEAGMAVLVSEVVLAVLVFD